MTASGCHDPNLGGSVSERKALPMVTLTQADKGNTVTLKRDEVVDIVLTENPSTGFRWIVAQDGDESLELLSSHYIPPTDPGIGGAGQHFWEFKAKEAGEARLLFKHMREWEGDKSVVEQLEFNIRVQH